MLSASPSSVPILPIGWSTPKNISKSEVEVLLGADLQEEESGEDDEYVPHEDLDTERDEVNIWYFFQSLRKLVKICEKNTSKAAPHYF